ncbi:MAG: shikimate dehydrogenase [Proteobacteria bacterium]|jgi:shikimate dehydrogenase|nr:shikimate dehydrogenase [Pseudomonadota bacterium]
MTDRYGVIGNPVAHSKGPQIHAAFARQTGQDLRYERILAPLGGFVEAVRAFRATGGRGLNVTLPFKIEACAFAKELTDRARDAGAVNTLSFDDGGGALGDNTDGAGLVADITLRLGVALAGRRVLVAGAGGAARGIVGPLLASHVAELVIVNRSPEAARVLAARHAQHAGVSGGAFGDLDDRGFDVVINATSASLGGNTLPLPAPVFGRCVLAYDLVYADQPTPFMRAASARGAAQVSDGLGMLVAQAAESFLLWRGVRPDPLPVMAELRPGCAAIAPR